MNFPAAGAMRGEGQVRAQTPVDVAVDQLGEQRRVEIAAVHGAGQQGVNRVEDLRIPTVGGTALLEQVPPKTVADVALYLAHHGVDAHLHIAHFAENASSTFPGSPRHSAYPELVTSRPSAMAGPAASIDPPLAGTWFTVSYSRTVLKSQRIDRSLVEYARM